MALSSLLAEAWWDGLPQRSAGRFGQGPSAWSDKQHASVQNLHNTIYPGPMELSVLNCSPPVLGGAQAL